MNPMKRVVIVAPDFSPSSLPPALRARFFATHLPAFGWEPIILTVDPGCYQWFVDPENDALVPQGLRVVRTGAISAKTARKIGIGDIGMRSLWQQWRELKRMCRSEKPDVLLISVPPYVTMLLGRMAHARFGIPYVIDYIDPWVTDYYQKLPWSQRPPKWFLADLMSKTIEPVALRRASHIVGVSRGTTDGVVERYSWLTGDQATEIPYGGESRDFEYLRAHPRRQSIFRKDDGWLHISSVGRGGADLYKALGAVFQCFREGLKSSPELFQKIRWHFVGTSYAPDASGQYCFLPLAREFGLESYVTEHPGRVSYLEAIQILLDSDALLALGSVSTHYTASKIFPYVLAQRPVLAVFHEDSSVVDILRESGCSIAVTFSDSKPEGRLLAELGVALRNLAEGAGSFQPQTRPEAIAEYSTKAMAARLTRVFDGILAAAPAETHSRRLSRAGNINP